MILSKLNGIFVAFIPGLELTECIESVIQECKVNGTSEKLEFNGQTNRIESYINANELAKMWYNGFLNEDWYLDQKSKLREEKINTIIG